MITKQKKTVRNNLFLLLKLFFTIAAYIYIYYRVSKFISQTELSGFFPTEKKKWLLLLVSFVLIPINWLLEAFKWEKLLANIEKISLKKSIQSVLIGITCAIFTPYRLGEYIGRPIVLKKKQEAVFANIVGSIGQNIVTFGLGAIGLLLLISKHDPISGHFNAIGSIGLFLFIVLLVFVYFKPGLFIQFKRLNKWKSRLLFLSQYRSKQLLYILGISLVRYGVFCTQYFLLLLFFGVNIGVLEAFIAISLSYVLLFSIPGIPIADLGIRASLALFLIGSYAQNDMAIVAASTTLWFFNLAIPALIGSLLLLKQKK